MAGSHEWMQVLFLLLVIGLALEPAYGQNRWPIRSFKVFFGQRGDLIETPDFLHDFTDQQIADIESLLGRAARKMEDMGFPPPRITDTTTLDDGTQAYMVYLYEYDGAPARYAYACEGEDLIPRIDLNAKSIIENGDIAPKAYSDTIHELFHAVQRATQLFIDECEPGMWITEGMAEAIGHDIARELRQSTVEEPGTNRALMRWGGRNYAVPLSVGRRTPQNKDLGYQSSSFWRYLAELTDAGMTGGDLPGSAFHETDYRYLPRILSRPIQGSGEKAELAWLHSALTQDPAIQAGLDEVYPNFAAVLAGYGRRIASSLSADEVRKRWLKVVYNGCHQVNLSLGASMDDASVDLGVVTSSCLEIRMVDRSGKVSVTVKGKHRDGTLLDQLSLALLAGTAQKANLQTEADGSGTATWTFSLDAPGPSLLILSNVAHKTPQNTKPFTADLAFSIAGKPSSSLRTTYESLLPQLPKALRESLLESFDQQNEDDQRALIARLKAR